ncbi:MULTISPECIES: hypothetical protein [Streptomyces]|uniref:hypothetical protein n=1 Tax=Streptomyces TaxID=1883 RepID=UPI000F767F1B|nr:MULTISPECIES: hypothetical protein [Streptomyces]RST06199.1 hypothetical protein EF910_10765 [Streptomyces sp. WAC07149]GLX17867.1 hypothetical protein Slala01_15110 [Streptomyces lavendulae subsp. lavendulae]GLX26211.1 hypothetical protein Slala02_20310 [Streptomyces lavendulae subsp. lavendulae]
MRLPHRHSGYALEAAAAVVVIAALVATRGTGTVGLVVYAVGQLLMIVPGAMQIRHHFAPPCAECVKVLPLNPAESAREPGRARRALWASHAFFGSVPRFGLVLLANASLAVLGCAPLYHLLGMEGAQRRAYLFLIAGIVLTVATTWTTRTHNRLAPWCPYCDDGDEDEEEPAVDPTDGRGQPAPV